jgi:hypothetical protein
MMLLVCKNLEISLSVCTRVNHSPPRAETGLVSWCLSDSTVIVEGVTVVCKSEASDCEEVAFKKDFFVELSLEAQCCMQDVND